MEFEHIVREIVEKQCEDYFIGMADLSLVDNVVIEKFRSLISEYPRAISIGITLPYKLTPELLIGKAAQIYEETNCQLKNITSQLSTWLEKEGHQALTIPKSKIEDDTSISLHKLAANWANLGWITKNGLLVTPEAGTGVNWGTVLTDALLE